MATDQEIEAILRAAPADRWRALWEAVDALGHDVTHARWHVEPPRTEVVDGMERVVHQLPWVEYDDAVRRVTGALGGVGAIVPFAWPDWDGVDRYRGGRGLDDAPVADAVRLVTAVIRSERFTEGSLEGALDDGTLAAAVRRLRRWYDEERPGG